MCGSYGVRLVHYIANRTTAKYEKKSSKEICYQGQLERLVLEYGELLGLFYWYLPEAVDPTIRKSSVTCGAPPPETFQVCFLFYFFDAKFPFIK